MVAERVLIIDDDEQIASYVRLSFSLAGYQVEWVRDGRIAVQKVRETLPDAVILDLKLPGINGFRICEQLRSEPQTRGVPIIVISGSWKDSQDRIRSIETHALTRIRRGWLTGRLKRRRHYLHDSYFTCEWILRL